MYTINMEVINPRKRCYGKIYTISDRIKKYIEANGRIRIGDECVYRGDVIITMEEINVNSNKNEITGNYKVALVNFITGTCQNIDYAFALYDDGIAINDLVVVDARDTYSIARVKNIIDQSEYVGVKVTKEIVCKVDFSAYEKRKEDRERSKILKNKMDQLVKQNQELVLYQMIAESNPEMAAMLEEYKKLNV